MPGVEAMGMNALQLALVYCPGPDLSTAVDTLRVLTKYFRYPAKHLGQAFGPRRSSPLHLVVQMGNSCAADFLLGLPGINPNARNARGYQLSIPA